ncbi:hypothetical protein PTTG_05503 [Puccinia triticina 1-1 BBBD Race 1]|uniref:RING-type domain-containing protein n=2 Tax=Puccinia triticina TaxID=208348 RepID=A0A0C4EXF5_PUCT1|nr:uncharacterized protein PtA15_16A8 [Puccinia triticina]OAV94993.1 hypothetical protein PTTG_05503 [Puccinia triticina 1-1 BBBD Race 1]WAQ92103.1 hypothetical protein PtA15_16A8 [Puccinia triticina]WAR63849.1 hypothetical protein PtB15_16B8 [Puccinia triticina]
MTSPTTSTIYVKHTSRIHASRPASFGPHFSNPDGQPMNLIPIESYLHHPSSPSISPATEAVPSTLVEPDPFKNRKGCPPSASLAPLSDQPPLDRPSATHPQDWIALIERGTCAFVDKVRYAQTLGASAVIVGDWQQSTSASFSPHHPFSLSPIFSQPSKTSDNFGFNSGLLTMYAPGDTSDVTIPSVFVARDSYLSLRQDWKEFSAISDQPFPHPPPADLDHLHSLEVIMSKDELWTWPFFDLVIILLFLPSILTIVTLLLHRISTFRKRRADRAPRELVNRLPSVIWAKDMEKGIPLLNDSHLSPPQDSPASLPVGRISALSEWLQNIQPRFHPIIFSNPRSEQTPLLTSANPHRVVEPVLRKQRQKVYFSQRECALCLSDFEVGDLIRILPCGHCFHQSQLEEQCMGIDCWLLKSKRFCPICRMSIVEEPEGPAETSTVDPIINPTSPVERNLTGLPSEPIPLPSNHCNRPVHNQYSTGTNNGPIPSSSSVTLDHACSRTRI